jgi:hypothetical protein
LQSPLKSHPPDEQRDHPLSRSRSGAGDSATAQRHSFRPYLRSWARAQVKIIDGADHFFGGYEEELDDALDAMLAAM